MEKRFERSVESLPDIFDFVGDFFRKHRLGQDDLHESNLLLEEIFTNQVKYHPESDQSISIQIDRDGDELLLCLTDFDVDPFDITQGKDVDTGLPLAQRRPGGLGLHFVKRVADRVSYEYKDRQSRITLIKKLGEQGA